MLKGGWTISPDLLPILKGLSDIELEDLRNKLTYAGYTSSEDFNELVSVVMLFIDDKNITNLQSKEDLWTELVNNGYKLGDRILNFNDPKLYGSDIEELQELLSRLGFYSDPINGVFTESVANSVTTFQENRGLSVDGNVGLGTVQEIRKLIRPNLSTSLNEAIKTISPNLQTSTIGYSVCFNFPNEGEYSQQIETYEITKEVCMTKNILASFASEIGQDVKEENIVNYVNKLQPTLFVSFQKAETESVSYFKGSFSESIVGKRLAEKLEQEVGLKSYGKSHNLLKNTKSVSLIIFGNYYQNMKIEKVLSELLNTLNGSFDS